MINYLGDFDLLRKFAKIPEMFIIIDELWTAFARKNRK